jgi:hypothetical protein
MPTTVPSPEAIERLTLSVLERLNADLPAAERIPVEPGTILMGEGGLLDSLAIANFIVGMEDGLEEAFGRSVPLSDQDLADLFEEASVTAQGFAAFVCNRMNR